MYTIKDALAYDDLMLVPKHSNIRSRSEVDLSVELPKGFTFSCPVMPANMSDIVSYLVAEEMFLMKGLCLTHRFQSFDSQLDIIDRLHRTYYMTKDPLYFVGCSIGVNKDDYKNVDIAAERNIKIICVDIAHGDSVVALEMCKYISNKYPHILLIAGNVATASGAINLWYAGADVVKVGVGSGCFAAGTRILMSNGFYKNIEEISIGDYVINKNGVPVKVLNAFCTGIKKVSKLRNSSYYKDTYVTPDHEFWVGDLGSTTKTIKSSGYLKSLSKKSKTIPKQSKYKWKPIRHSIRDSQNDILFFPRNISFNLPETFKISLDKKDGGNWRSGYSYSEDSVITPSYESGYLFGTFLGDGHALCAEYKGSHIGNVSWYFGKEEIDIANKLSNCIQTIFNKIPQVIETESTINVIFYYKPLADFLFGFGKKLNKHLPENLLVNNKDYLNGIYDGLLDSDGHYAKDGRNFVSNTSVYIIELFNILNVILHNYVPNNSLKGKNIGGLENCNADNLNDAYLARTIKRSEWRLTKDFYIVKILDYVDTDLEIPVYDLTVDCDTHSFIANNMIVHNSICLTRMETGNGVPVLQSILDVSKVKTETERLLGRKLAVIADGGVRCSGDIVKSLCFADMVMAGNIFAGAAETPSKTVIKDGVEYKEYAGSSTHKENHIEGVLALVKPKESIKEIMRKLLEGVRSGCAYQNSRNLKELKEDVEFVRITSAGLKESHAHDVVIK